MTFKFWQLKTFPIDDIFADNDIYHDELRSENSSLGVAGNTEDLFWVFIALYWNGYAF